MMPAVRVRPMLAGDAARVHALADRAFGDLAVRSGSGPSASYGSPAGIRCGVARIRHLIATDPGGAFVAEDGGTLLGAALALQREGLWGLSLLVVDPAAQSAGLGSRLLRFALDYGTDVRGAIILASEDSRALRAYARAGFALHPSLEAAGVPRPVEAPPSVRPGSEDDLGLAGEVDRAVRGAAHGPDLLAMLANDNRMLVVEDRGYAMAVGGDLRLLAATDEQAAADLLRAHLAGTPAGERASVEWVTPRQGWALPVLLEAGLDLHVGGAIFLRGEVGSFSASLPNGAYL